MEKREMPLLASAMLITLLVNLDSSVLVRYVMLFVAGVFLVFTMHQMYKTDKSIKELRKQPTLKA